MYCDHTLDAQGRLVDVLWSSVQQQGQISRFGGCTQLDTTVFTNRRYGCHPLFVVGVDDENRRCILGQGLLRSESTETFEWILNRYEAAAGCRKPKKSLSSGCRHNRAVHGLSHPLTTYVYPFPLVILTDADLAMSAAIDSCWPRTLHLHCLWHV
ncbi:unnamed protein product [Ectocarpus sp. 12 AP-2014]